MSKKISQLTAVVTPAGSDQFEVNQSGTSKRMTLTQVNSIEATARAAADTTLQNNINTEATARANADTTLQTDINNRIKKDGSVTFTADQPMGTHKLTGLAAGTTAGDSVRYEQTILTSGANAFAANQSFGTFKATNLGDPSSAQDAVTLAYLKNRGLWDTTSTYTLLNIATTSSPVTITAGTENNNYIIYASTTISANKVINVVTTANKFNVFKLSFPTGFTVAAGVTLTIQLGGTAYRTFTAGTYPATQFAIYGSGFLVEEDVNSWYLPASYNAVPIHQRVKILTGLYKFSASGGSISTLNVKDVTGLADLLIPAGSIVLKDQVIVECKTAFTSGGAATIAWGYTGTTNAFYTATAYSSAPYTAANSVAKGSVTTITKLTSASNVTMTIAGAALTDGEAFIHIPIMINNF